MAKKSDSFYFGNFYACADCAYQAAHLLERVMRDFDPLLESGTKTGRHAQGGARR